ncbi:HAD hydrolase-like protein [Paenarthrobacter aurescens]|uniref:Phosphoglycolate phosphatase n=1 Tax=Paenarthrobacter aurescens TaxID=43663 RepID=A0A4Y3NLN1_PAEAU|nr:HAD hydrolase-like protein [Paenarthrobacter aurescens]MDO6143523.1 HAD hydrolase-like protein [Paenarthrobacter aurescens]MDO6147371.1 HAD hydrolase-like protein [Paenarthrobacter aurescens]MDO6158615.1 HAD hydrolase-like protein [Paenarthrobacter aurescens]MDO6162598.1 HAD hydrolase-like protein [Paenarthrobacter aurescens]GEB19871.1 phosphoglycolate phosphatase [Paenarthrobacter aurescens]
MTQTTVPVIFDLDGTLVDPAGGITGGISAALREMDLPVPEQAVLNSMVGPKLSDSLLHLANVPSGLVDETIERYRRHYKETGIGQSKLYPGIFDLLEFFAETGRPVAVATQKPQSIARLVLEHHGIAGFFVSIRGAADDESLGANTAPGKVEIVGAALKDLHSQPAVMVGDRFQDVVGAQANGLDCIGVSWGFAPDGELEEAGAAAVVATAAELRSKIEELDAVRTAALSEVQNDGSL